jgi:hypothetical protein
VVNIVQGRRRPARSGPRRVLAVIALIVALLSLGYVFVGFWTPMGDAAAFVDAERQGITYARPLSGLLAALVDAQNAAVRGKPVDATAVRTAVDDVSRVDGQLGGSLGVGQRWSKVPGQVESALNAKATGQEALRTYAAPIALTHALLGEVGELAQVVRDPELDAFHLVDAALFRVPDVIVNAGELSAVAHITQRAVDRDGDGDPRGAVALDRLVKASAAISAGLRAGADASAGDTINLGLLGPLDEFSAAVDALSKTPTNRADDVEGARARVHKAATGLESSVLAALDSSLQERAGALNGQRRYAMFAGVLAALASVALLLLRPPGSGSPPGSPARGPGGRHHGQAPDDGEPSGDLINARELHDLVGAGGQSQANRRRAR